MGSPPLATLSVSSFVHSVGADVGFASIIGLAILVLLFFSQARETASLRDRLEDAHDRIGGLEGRISQLLRAQPPAPVPAPVVPASAGARAVAAGGPVGVDAAGASGAVSSRAASSNGIRGPLLGAPAGLAAPALTAATKLIPTPELVRARAVPAAGATPTAVAPAASAATPTAAGAQVSPAVDAPAPSVRRATPDPAVPAVASGSAPASGSATGSGSTVAVPALGGVAVAEPDAPQDTMFVEPATAAAGLASARSTGATAVASLPLPSSEPRTAVWAGAAAPPPRRPGPPVLEPAPSRGRQILMGLVALVVVAVIVVALLLVTGSTGTKTARVHHGATVGGPAAQGGFTPASVTVSVLNGTAVNNVAHDVAVRLTTAGYKVPAAKVANAAEQTHNTTIVAYTPGHALDADHVATQLRLPRRDVRPADAAAMGIACPGVTASACAAQVIVTVGADVAAATGGSGGSTGSSSTVTP